MLKTSNIKQFFILSLCWPFETFVISFAVLSLWLNHSEHCWLKSFIQFQNGWSTRKYHRQDLFFWRSTCKVVKLKRKLWIILHERSWNCTIFIFYITNAYSFHHSCISSHEVYDWLFQDCKKTNFIIKPP